MRSSDWSSTCALPIYGRPPAVATGVKLANPALDVWLVTGDGDGLSIGGTHMLPVLRRNVNMQIMLFNNQIYGLTKGQARPEERRVGKERGSPVSWWLSLAAEKPEIMKV